MARQRNSLPQVADGLLLTDGGLETTLVFHEGIELPEFAAFTELASEAGRQRLRDYFRSYARIAHEFGVGFIFESMTWRASRDWGAKLGYSAAEVAAFNRQGIALLAEIRREFAGLIKPMYISGCLGSRGDGYQPEQLMTAEQARDYHREQIEVFAETDADLVSAYTIPYSAEAIGITQAAQEQQMPVVIGFTIETDGRLPSGESLQQAIEQVDAATGHGPHYYLINCAHPEHFAALFQGAPWTERIHAIRANASKKSHAELDEATEIDEGDPAELAENYQFLKTRLPNLHVAGGCCGTDRRHVASICQAMLAA